MTTAYPHAYIIAENCRDFLLAETNLAELRIHDRLVLTHHQLRHGYWAQCRLSDCSVHEFDSVSDAAKILWAQKKKWYAFTQGLHRRTALIKEKIRNYKTEPQPFPARHDPETGVFSLVDKHLLFTANSYDTIFPAGETNFIENREAPPSRAYLKLWEALGYLQYLPGSESRCLDIGSSPGGWTWVLLELGAQVLSVDRSPLTLKNPGQYGHRLKEETGDAFKYLPEKVGPIDFLVCDLACYPDKLFDFIAVWIKSGLCKTFICTLKMQKTPDWSAIEKFAGIKGSSIRHLFHNKHELTFIYERHG